MIPVLPPNLTNPLGPQSPPQSVSPLRLLTEGDRALLDATVLPGRLPNLVVGEEVTARIAEQLSDSQVAVLIKNALFTLTLPAGLQPKGDTLNLRVVSLKPGLSFALTDSEGGGEEGKDASVQVDLSPASRYLTRLLSAANPDQSDDTATGAGGKSPSGLPGADGKTPTVPTAPGDATAQNALERALAGSGSGQAGKLLTGTGDAQAAKTLALDAGGSQPAQVAEQLKQSVEKSGLFYESHLKAWDQGQLPLERLQGEPQAKVGQLLGQDTPQGRAAVPELGNLVQRQLSTFENQQVPLQGFAWPGQPMQMLIEQEKTDERDAHGDAETQSWTTHLALNLPVLGGVSARVRMVGKAVQLSFLTEEGSAGDLIRNNSQKLEDGLAAAGLSLATLSVKHEEAES
jgi:hypothetical protein